MEITEKYKKLVFNNSNKAVIFDWTITGHFTFVKQIKK